MKLWIAKVIIFLATTALIGIRAPYGRRSLKVPISRNRQGLKERVVLCLVVVAFVLPVIWVITPVFRFADYPLNLISLVAGSLLILASLWIFHRSHVDLGSNWSVTLQIRESHSLVQHGVYRWVQHPMYLALFLYSVGQALVVPNWLVGPWYLLTFILLMILRLRDEEEMMVDRFGEEYIAYQQRTKRLVPGVW